MGFMISPVFNVSYLGHEVPFGRGNISTSFFAGVLTPSLA